MSAALVTLVLYQVLLIAIGLAVQSRTRADADFFLGGRRLPAFVAAIGASASSSSSWTLLGVSGAAYAWGPAALWLFPACVGGFLLNWTVVAPALRPRGASEGAITLVDLLAGRGEGAATRAVRRLAALIVLVSLLAYVASQLQGVSKTLGGLTGLQTWQSVVLGAGVVLVYTAVGGMWAVGLTDTLQGLLMAATSLVLPLLALAEVGGPGALWERLAASGSAGAARPATLGFTLGLLGIGLGYPGQPHVVKYFMAMRAGAGAARTARRAAVLWAIVTYAGMLVLGLCGRVLAPGLADREVVLVELAGSLLPPVLSGVVLAAVLSAILSTADSQLLVAASTVAHDLAPRRRAGGGSLLRSRLSVVLLTVLATGAALVGSERIFSRVLFAWAAMGCAFGPYVLVSLVGGWRVTASRALVAMALGFALSVGAYQMRGVEAFAALADWQGALERVLPFAVGCVVLLAGPRRGA